MTDDRKQKTDDKRKKMDYKELNVWKEAIKLVKITYEITAEFPKSEKYSLVSQLRRASVSIPSNIAEGSSRSSDKDYKRFVEIAIGSTLELETQLIISKELDFLDKESEVFKQLETVKKLLAGFKNI